MKSSLLSLVLLLLPFGLRASYAQEDAARIDRSQAESRLAEATATLGAMAPAEDPESPEAFLRQAWERREQLLEELLGLIERSEGQEGFTDSLEQRREALARRLAEFESLPPATDFDSATEEGFAELEGKVGAQRDRTASLRSENAEKERFVEQVPELLAAARSRLQDAQEREERLRQEEAAATDAKKKELLATRAENAELDAEVARTLAQVLEKDRDQEKDLAPLRVEELDLAQRNLERLEEQYGLYGEALQAMIERETDRLEEDLARLEKEVASAQGPVERFVAETRLAITGYEKSARECGRRLLTLRTDLEEQQQRLTAELEELRSLREYLEKAGAGEQAAERVKFTMQRAKLRRQALERTSQRYRSSELADLRSERFQLEDKLFFLKETWEQEVTAVAAGLNEAEAREFRATAQSLFEPYRAAVRNQRDQLSELISTGQELQVAVIERRAALDDLTTFIRSKVFWIRDAKPIGPAIWARLQEEARVVGKWARGLAAPETVTRLTESLTRPGVWVAALFLLAGLPAGLYWLRQRLRRFVTRVNDRTLRDEARIADRFFGVSAGVLSVALLPAYVFIAARSIDAAGLPPEIGLVLGGFLSHLAFFLLFWFLSRSFFAGRGTAQVQFGMDRSAAHGLHRSLSLALLGYLAFYSVRSLLLQPPFRLGSLPLETLPRLAYTLFLLTATVAGILLFHPRSSFSRYWSSALGRGFWASRWPVVAGFVCVGGVVISLLDIAGYRYSSSVLGKNLVQSLAVLLLLVPVYKAVLAMVRSYARARSRDADVEDEDRATPRGGGDLQLAKFLRVVFAVAGVVLIAGLWGVDQQAFETLDQLRAYDIRDVGEIDEFVSYGDLLRAVFYVLATYLLLKHIPGIYEYGLFSRLKVDSGIEYAILTMSRYGIFTLGAIVSLSAIHLDLGRLGWLMAAVGVGLGFGLQEIVSNFVSGIILLIERPVRVGDVVTVGSTTGKVQRINIRATSVLNFDRQEIIVPNRSLITQDVTNWTRSDTIIRLVVPIGVAYGTDVDEVTNLLLEIASEQPEILGDPPAQAFFLNHGESSLDFELRVFIPDPSVKMSLLHRLNRLINQRLTERDIEIPFPQRDLHIRSTVVPRPESLGTVELPTVEKAPVASSSDARTS